MPTEFRLKSGKNRNISEKKTLDEKHKKIMSKFESDRNALPEKKEELLYYTECLEDIEKKHPSLFTDDDISNRSKYRSKIKQLKEEIYDIENIATETDYYCKVDDILVDYYGILEENMIDLEDNGKEYYIREEPKKKQLDTLDLLNIKNKNKEVKKVSKRRKKRVVDKKKKNIMNYFVSEEDNNNEEKVDTNIRSQLLDEYNTLTDSSYVSEKNINYNLIKKCNNCDSEKTLIHAEGACVCENCGEVERVTIEPEKSNYKDVVPEKPGYPYKKINHFNEWLSQFQGKESVDIPPEVYNSIKAELKKKRITDYKKLTVKNIQDILKDLGLSSYYEHKIHIMCTISKVPPPVISRETEEKLREMFKMIQEPFERHRPKTRVNFLSYSYVFHKFFELLELDQFIKYFPLLKSPEKLKHQDQVWEKICKDLHWEFIPSETKSRF